MPAIFNNIINDAGPFESKLCSDDWIDFKSYKYYKEESSDIVYFSREISPQVLVNLPKIAHKELPPKVGVKLSTGEKGGVYYLNPNLIQDIVKLVDGTIVECNTAYDGKRNDTPSHMRVANEHGFTDIAKVDIMDTYGDMIIPPVEGSKYLTDGDYVGKNLADYKSLLVLSHGKGHQMAGMGGALKNISIGIASRKGKSYIHSAGSALVGFAPRQPVDEFQRSMAEAAADVIQYFHGNMLFITVMNNISIDCDCNSHPKEPDVEDIGIICSTNPVVLDQCMYDLYKAAPNNKELSERMDNRHAIKILDSMEELGFNRYYNIQEI